eukprot:gene3867-7081_t
MKTTQKLYFKKNYNLLKSIQLKYDGATEKVKVDQLLLSKHHVFKPLGFRREDFLYKKLLGLKDDSGEIVNAIPEIPFKAIDTALLKDGKTYELLVQDFHDVEVSQVSFDDKQHIRKLFDLIDNNGNGVLTESEVAVDFKLLLKAYCAKKIEQSDLDPKMKEAALKENSKFVTTFIDSWMIVKGFSIDKGLKLEQFLEFGCKVINSHEKVIRGLLQDQTE